MRELGANVIFLPAVCEQFGINYILMIMFLLGYSLYNSNKMKYDIRSYTR